MGVFRVNMRYIMNMKLEKVTGILLPLMVTHVYLSHLHIQYQLLHVHVV